MKAAGKAYLEDIRNVSFLSFVLNVWYLYGL
jgi:hypothetical protein